MNKGLRNKLNKFKKQQKCDRERAAHFHEHFCGEGHGGSPFHHVDEKHIEEAHCSFVSIISLVL